MAARLIVDREAARDCLRQGANALADAKSVAWGPRGRIVIIKRDYLLPQIVNLAVAVTRRALKRESRIAGLSRASAEF